MSENSGDRLVYSEKVTVDLGDYEKREVFISLSTDIRTDEGEDFESALKRIKPLVKKARYYEEKKIRKMAVEDVSFDTMARLMK